MRPGTSSPQTSRERDARTRRRQHELLLTFCKNVWTGDSEHSEGYYNRQWNYVVNGRGDYNGDPLAESACDNAYRN